MMRKTEYLSGTDVLAQVKTANSKQRQRNPNNPRIYKNVSLFGFDVVYCFIKLNQGWVKHYDEIEMADFYHCLSLYGDREDRVKFNTMNIPGEKKLPVTRKELALERKATYKSAEGRHIKALSSFREKKSNKEHSIDLASIKSQGYSILRRSKKGIGDNLYKFILSSDADSFHESILKNYYVEVKGLKEQGLIPCVQNTDDLLDILVKLKTRAKYKNIVIPTFAHVETKIHSLINESKKTQ